MKHSLTRSGYGIFSLFIMFFVFVMMMLSILYYQEAKNQQITSKRYEEHVEEYYEADAKAIAIRNMLIAEQSDEIADAYQLMIDDDQITYAVKMKNDMELYVKLNTSDLSIMEWYVKGR